MLVKSDVASGEPSPFISYPFNQKSIPGSELLYGLYSVTVTVKFFELAALYPTFPVCVTVIVAVPPPTGFRRLPELVTKTILELELV